MGPREKQQARAITPPPASPKGGKGGKAPKASEKSKKRTQEAPPASPPARGRRGGASQVSDAAQDAREEAQLMATAIVDADDDKTPPPSPPAQRGLTERQKNQAEVQKRNNEAKTIADLNAKLAAANAQLKLALDKDKKRKESSSGESANPGRQKKMSNASTRRKQVPIFRFNYFSGCHFFDRLSVHRQSLILLTLIMPIL